MDFGSILHAAQQNSSLRKEVKYYPSKFGPPKKESKLKTLSANIQKFIAKQAAEVKQKELEKRKKRDELIANRDPKMQKKIQKMLKVCKSANKSVLEDAIDHNNTAVTITGYIQPDEDDYGYVSQESNAYFNKMMEKYSNIQDEVKFPTSRKRSSGGDLLGTKDRVRQALIREKEEAMLPHKRQRKSKSEGVPYEIGQSTRRSDKDLFREPEKLPESKLKPRRPAPPPLTFDELLKIAEKKAHEPVKIEKIIQIKKDKEPERLMTNKEKREYEQHKLWLEQRAERERARSQNNNKNGERAKNNETDVSDKINSNQRDRDRSKESERMSNKPQSSGPAGRIPKLNGYQTKTSQNGQSSNNNTNDRNTSGVNNSKLNDRNNTEKYAPPREESFKLYKSLTSGSKNSSSSFKNDYSKNPIANKSLNSAQRQNQNSPSASKPKEMPIRNSLSSSCAQNMKSRPASDEKSRPFTKDNKGNRQPYSNGIKASDKGGHRPPSDKTARSSGNCVKGSRQFPPNDVKTSRQFPPQDVKTSRQFSPQDVKTSRQFPPQDVKTSRQFTPQDVKRKQFLPKDLQRKQMVNKRRILDDDDSEYDSELDDFIVDGPEQEEDYSKHIKDIFGYDKTRYRDEDFDDRIMVSNYAQQMREEYISGKIGLLEDLEDIRLEKLEKKQKAKAKKLR